MSTNLKQFDPLGSASHRNLFEHIAGPLSAGAVDHVIPVDNNGWIKVEWSAREPLLILGLKNSLADEHLEVEIILDPDGAKQPLPVIRLSEYTEQGAFLPACLPGVAGDTQRANSFTLALKLRHTDPAGNETSLPQTQIRDHIEARLIEGILGRIAYILGVENLRIRRTAREICMMRTLGTARDNALDRIGAELSVPRFMDEIQYDKAKKEIVTVGVDPNDNPIVESDDDYGRRLKVYRPFLYPSRRHLLTMLNGPGKDNEPNRGFLGELGLKERFSLVEQDNPFAVAIHLIAIGPDSTRINFLNHLRKVYLIAPRKALENTRYLSSKERDRQKKLRGNLNKSFVFNMNHFIAPLLANTLDRLSRCRSVLLGGGLQKRNILRAQDHSGGSRYELGLGVDMQPLSQGELNTLRAKVINPNRQEFKDGEVEGIIRKMAAMPPPTAAEDADGRWFLQACGLRTVHRINNGRLYISHLPTFGLKIEGVSSVIPGNNIALSAHYQSENDKNINVVLAEGLDQSASEWAAVSAPKWQVLTYTEAQTRWRNAGVRTNSSRVFRKAGLPVLSSAEVTNIENRLNRVPADLVATIRLKPSQANEVLANHPDADDNLKILIRILRDNGIVSVLPLFTGTNEVVLVCGVIGLPGAGLNLSERRTSGFRWYRVPIQGEGGKIGTMGSHTVYSSSAGDSPGLTAAVVVGYARREGFTDPFEYRVDMQNNGLLNLKQYEFLMNVLAHSYPMGVEVNTFKIRREHVDLSSNGQADALNPSVARTYRQFQRLRHRGEIGVETAYDE